MLAQHSCDTKLAVHSNDAKLVALESRHFDEIEPQFYQSDFLETLQRDILLRGNGWALVDGDRILALFGYVIEWSGRGACWTVIGNNAPMLTLTRLLREMVWAKETPHRLETLVEFGFNRGLDWCDILGFEREGLMRDYFGSTSYWLLARIKHG